MSKKMQKRIMAFVLVLCMVIGNFSGVSAAPKKTVKATSVKLNKSLITLKAKQSYNLKATIEPKKATTKTLIWSSSNKKVATVTSKGKVTAKKNGTAVITVKVKGTKKSAKCTVKVGNPVTKVTLTPGSISMFPNQSKTLKATLKPSNATTRGVTYKSSNTAVATVDKKGKVTAKKVGTATITATAKDGTGKKASVKVTVLQPVTGITLTAGKSFIEVGEKIRLNTVVTPANANNKAVTYTSSNSKVATVDSSGNVTAKGVGTAVIKAAAKDGSNKSGQVKIEVRASLKSISWKKECSNISRIEAGKAVAIGVDILPVNAKIKSVVYSTSDEKIARVADGQLLGLSNGVVTITATATDVYGNKKTIKLENIQVYTPVTGLEIGYTEADLFIGETKNLEAVIYPETASNKEMVFASDNEAAATVNAEGIVTAVGEGVANIKVTSKENEQFFKICHIVVKVPAEDMTLTSSSDTLYVGQNVQLQAAVTNESATDKTFTYTSSDMEIATVNEEGKVSAVKAGTVEITVRANGARDLQKKVSLTVKPIVTNVSWNEASAQVIDVNIGSDVQLGYIVAPAGVEYVGTFSSDNEEVATVSQEGIVSARKNGKANIIVTVVDKADNTIVLKKEITVKTPVTGLNLNASDKLLLMDEEEQNPTFQINATVLPTTASNQRVSYASSNEGVATVSATGLVTGVGEGEAVITVTTEDGHKTQTVNITVNRIVSKRIVSTTEEITAALIDKDVQIIKIKNAERVDIPKGNYENVSLIVDSPSGHIENHATFKDVKIEAISDSTYVEHANNSIDYQARTGTIRIAPQSSATLNIQRGAGDLKLINDGTITAVVVNTSVNVDITGESDNRIELKATREALDCRINTTKNLDVVASAKIELMLAAGAESTRVKVEQKEQLPKVNGLGRVEVVVSETSDVEVIVGENTADVTAQKVNVKGSVTCAEGLLSGADVYLVPYRSAITEENIEGFIDEDTVRVQTDAEGNYETGEVTIGNYYLFVKKEGYQNAMTTLVLTSNNNNIFYADMVYMIVAKENAVGSATGTLFDAQTGKAVVEGISLRIREGVNNLTGEPLAVTQTDDDGKYTFTDLPVGQYTIQVIDNREGLSEHYMNSSFNIVIEEGENVIPDNSISRTLDSEQVRFVLSWGDEESGASRDLDSHMVGPTVSGKGQFHTYFSVRDYYDRLDDNLESELCVNLDVDDTTWEGPETTTIYKKSEGKYTFYVHDYSNGGSEDSTQMSKSQAVVRVYVGGHLEETFSVPNQPGTLWKVCEFDAASKKIKPVNEMSFWTGDVDEIGINLSDKYRGMLSAKINTLKGIRANVTDENEISKLDKIISDANAVLDSATDDDTDILKEEYSRLLSKIEEYESKVRISKVVGNEIDTFYLDTVDGINVLEIVGFAEKLPEIEISASDEGSTVNILDSDIEDYKKKVVVISDTSYKKTYYIEYRMSSDVLNISQIATEDGRELDYDCSYYDSANVLNIYGLTSEYPDNIVITPYYSKAQVSEIVNSDNDNYDKMFTITVKQETKKYYVKWNLSDEAWAIESISSDSSMVTNWTYGSSYDDSGNKNYYIRVGCLSPDLPNDLRITAKSPEAQVSGVVNSEDGSHKVVKVSVGNITRTYNLIYSQDLSGFSFDIMDDDDRYLNSTFEKDVVNGETVNILKVAGKSPEAPQNWRITSWNEDIVVNLEDVPAEEGYEKYSKVVIAKYNDVEVKFYVLYEISEDALEVINVSSKDEDGNELILSSSVYYEEIIDSSDLSMKTYFLNIQGKVKELPENLDVDVLVSGAEVTVEDTTFRDYKKKVVATYGNLQREYYIVYDADTIVNVGEVYCDNNDERITYNYRIKKVTEGQDEINVISVAATSLSAPDNISVSPEYNGVSVVVEESDRDKYIRKVTLSINDIVKVYYIDYVISEDGLNISRIISGQEENMIEYEFWTDYDASDKEYIVISARSLSIPEDLRIECSFQGATSELIDSDNENFDKIVRFSVGDIEKTYYIKYKLTSGSLEARSASAIINNKETITSCDQYWDDDGNDVLSISGYPAVMPDNMVILTYIDGLTYEVVDSDNDLYEKMAIIEINDVNRKYYIRYSQSKEFFGFSLYADEEWYSYKEVEEVINGEKIRVLEVSARYANEPSEWSVSPYWDEAVVDVQDVPDTAGYEKFIKKIVITYDEYTAEFYIHYSVNAESLCVKEITSGQGDNPINYNYGITSEGEGENEYWYIDITALSDSLPEDLVVRCSFEGATSQIMDSDKSEFDKMVRFSYEELEKCYYIRYEIKEESFNVRSVSAKEDGLDRIVDYDFYNDWTYVEENEIRIPVLNIRGTTPDLPANLQVAACFRGLSYEISESDMEAYEKMAVLTYGEYTAKYYIVYEQNLSDFSVYSLYGDGVYYSYNNQIDYVNNEKINVLKINGNKAQEPVEWTIDNDMWDEVIIEDVQAQEGYDKYSKRILIKCNGKAAEYYLLYTLSLEALGIDNVSAVDENGEEIIIDWDISNLSTDEFVKVGNGIEILNLHGTYKVMPDNLIIETVIPEADKQLVDSDLEGYEKKLVVSYGDLQREYYISYSTEQAV